MNAQEMENARIKAYANIIRAVNKKNAKDTWPGSNKSFRMLDFNKDDYMWKYQQFSTLNGRMMDAVANSDEYNLVADTLHEEKVELAARLSITFFD